MEKKLIDIATQVLETCRNHGLKLVTAESCTGGLIAATLTEIPGSSDVLDRGFVTYSNQAKSDMLGVTPQLIQQNGAVSELVARHMAQGALSHSGCDVAIAVTGIAGPDGGSADKPVGTVHIAVAQSSGDTWHEKCNFGDVSRNIIRQKTVLRSLALTKEMVSIPVST